MTTIDTTALPPKRRYTGTKVIDAIPMTRLAYNVLRGWTLPADENGDDAGYLVEYIDGGKANVEGFTGYVSWSPSDVFEKAYKPSGTWQERIRLDVAETQERLDRLTSDDFSELTLEGQQLVREQRAAMQVVLTIMRQREALLD